jgi:hypothetical protein
VRRGAGVVRGRAQSPVAASASVEPKMALPATRTVAPASTMSATLERSTPPSISICAGDPAAASSLFSAAPCPGCEE